MVVLLRVWRWRLAVIGVLPVFVVLSVMVVLPVTLVVVRTAILPAAGSRLRRGLLRSSAMPGMSLRGWRRGARDHERKRQQGSAPGGAVQEARCSAHRSSTRTSLNMPASMW